jgi:UDP-2,4-diacetamido-2,4,6-trideoxy-beta-L-altropyranose hydrolase
MHNPATAPIPLPQQDLILRCDASSTIGAGHVVRSLTLAESWQQAGGVVTLVGRVGIGWLREQIERSGIRFIALGEADSLGQEIALLAGLDGVPPMSWLILDGYQFDTAYHTRIRDLGFRLCVIDDMAHLNFYDADVVVNQNPSALALRYNCPPHTVLLLGTGYALLRRQFRDLPQSPKEIPSVARQLLVTFGGADTHMQWCKVLDALTQITTPALTVKIVGVTKGLAGNATAGLLPQHKVEFLPNVTQMVDLMQPCDVALCASGSTTLELAYLGVPMLVTAIADNQMGIMNGLAQSGAVLALGWHEDVTAAQIAAQLDSLLVDPGRRQQMSRAGQRLVDGLGVRRLISALLTSSEGAL